MKKNSTTALALVTLLACVPAFAQDTSQSDSGSAQPQTLPLGPACQTIDGTLGSGSPSWPSTSGTQTGRLNRNGIASSCVAPKACLIFDSTPGRAFDAYTFSNNSGATACVDVTLNTLTQAACNLQVNGYLGTYNPVSICTGYLADPGVSSGIPPSPINFSTNVPNGQDLILVVHTTNPGEIGCLYDLILTGDCIGMGGDSDLDLTKTVDDDTVPPGGTVTYTLIVTNNGPDDANNVVVTDNLPAEFSWASDDCGAGPPAGGPPNGTLTWNVGLLANGAAAVCNVTGTVDGAPGTVVVNDASAVSDSTDPTPAFAAAAIDIQQSILEIPTLSQVGLVFFLLLLAVSAFWLLRTRRAKAQR